MSGRECRGEREENYQSDLNNLLELTERERERERERLNIHVHVHSVHINLQMILIIGTDKLSSDLESNASTKIKKSNNFTAQHTKFNMHAKFKHKNKLQMLKFFLILPQVLLTCMKPPYLLP